MKVYLVGGAVRDQLLNYEVKERDWVVVGATAELMLAKGFQQVGRDFPVFLHPKTREEYALARKERKLGPGYYGFECDINHQITLEQDLQRRDLTINAMAMDEAGHLIDPYHGEQDLKNKTLRHVSDAFIEDPVRVLRVARFAARYHHLGFKLAPETRLLMYKMVIDGELSHLVPERVWQEWEGSLQEKNPEVFIKTLRACGALAVIFPEIDKLFGVPAQPHYHPEIDTGVHTLMALEESVKLSMNPMLRFATITHDLGKAITPMNQWPGHRGHDNAGIAPIDALCQRLRIPVEFRKFALMVSKFHITVHCLLELSAENIVQLLDQSDAFRRPQLFEQLLMVCEADAKGRLITVDYQQRNKWLYILKECLNIPVKALIEQGYQGIAIKEELNKRRVICTELILTSWKTDEK